ncbi:MAG: hypothetical protein SVY10_06455 [Thermodesulfobacteriota bacterium]|nr:hypothetical protein [Thermodesulfobacteriota bacterium]
MKKLLFLPLMFFILSFSGISMAQPETITIHWNIVDTSNIQGYKIYYAYDSGMTNQQLIGQTNDPYATQLTCTDVDIVYYPVYFTVESIMANGDQLASSPLEVRKPDPPQNLRIVDL